MNFIAETNKYARHIEAWKNGHGFSDREALQDLANIWDEFKALPERRVVIYPHSNTIAPKTDLSCGSCIHDLLTFVYNWRRELVHEVSQHIPDVPQATIETVDFKGVDSPEVKELKQEIIESLNSYDKPISINTSHLEFTALHNEPIKFDGMKMHQIRSIAKKKGLEYTNKTTKEELIKLLSNEL